MKPYSFFVIRYRPDRAIGEFVNVGVAMHDIDGRLFLSRITRGTRRAKELWRGLSKRHFKAMIAYLRARLSEFADRKQDSLPLSSPRTIDSLRSELCPDDSGCFICSDVFSGIAESPAQRLDELFVEFCGETQKTERTRRDERAIWQAIEPVLAEKGLLEKGIPRYTVSAGMIEHSFHMAWKNGQVKAIEPISFDLARGDNILSKATDFYGKLEFLLSSNPGILVTGVISRPTDPELVEHYREAQRVLASSRCVESLVEEREFKEKISQIADSLTH